MPAMLRILGFPWNAMREAYRPRKIFSRDAWVPVIFVSGINLLLQSWKHARTDFVIQAFEDDV